MTVYNTNTVKILCEAFRAEYENSAFKCERRLISQAFSHNHTGKMLVTIIDDAHLMEMSNLRKLRLLFEDFPKNHNLILIGTEGRAAHQLQLVGQPGLEEPRDLFGDHQATSPRQHARLHSSRAGPAGAGS